MRGLSGYALRFLDEADRALGELGLSKRANFADLETRSPRALYAGRLGRHLRQFKSSSLGLTPFAPSSRNIDFDVSRPLPLPDGYLDLYQSEDVFEHVEYDRIAAIFQDIHRVLRPGGLFRLSLPDYRFDMYRARSVRDAQGTIVFDPGGGGSYQGGRVVDGGHVWFPNYEQVRDLFEHSLFASAGSFEFLQYTAPDGSFVMKPIDFGFGYVQRVPGNDSRVADRPRPISIVVDARKAG